MTIAIIGAGSMGTGIAQVAATAGHEVLLYELDEGQRSKSLAGLQKILNRQVDKGRMTDTEVKAIIGNLRYVEQLSDLASAGLVIEAIVENLDIKKKVFAELEGIVSADCILATNTSSLSIASIAAACERPGRVIGIHFFNPAPLMKLVEVIPAVQTDPDLPGRVKSLLENWGKLVVLAKDTPGFIVNRVARPFYGEALRILEEGLADVVTIDHAMREIGKFRMGPFQLMDYIGHDVNYKVTETVFAAFYYDPRYRPSFTQKRLVEAGYLGRKSGRGFYEYDSDRPEVSPRDDFEANKKIVNRILVMLINEAADARYLNVAGSNDIDTAMQHGTNYPKGLLQWADDRGIPRTVEDLDALYNVYHEDRYRCSPLLRKMAAEGKTFFPVKKKTVEITEPEQGSSVKS